MAGSNGSRIGRLPWRAYPHGTGKSSKGFQTSVLAPSGGRGGPARSIHAQGLLKEMKGIADTGFLVAFGNRRDTYHHWALGIAKSLTEPLLTCEAVLAEAAFHLGSVRLVMAFIEEGLVRPDFQLYQRLERLKELAVRYADRAPDLADLCLICLSELHPKLPVISTDVADFRVYRRGRREIIPLIHPPDL